MSRIAANVAGATYVELPGAPHMPTLETPHLVIDVLDSFLPRAESSHGDDAVR